MVRVDLLSVFPEYKWKASLFRPFGAKGTRWYAMVALSIEDLSSPRRQVIAEWFYLMVCSEEFVKEPKKGVSLPDARYLVVQREFNLEEVEAIARNKFKKVAAKDWDEFYLEMQKEFIYEV